MLLSHIQIFVTPWTVARRAPPSMGFSRQEYRSGLPFPSPRESSWPSDQTRGLPHCRQILYHLNHQGILDSILKSRDITLPRIVHLVKAMDFPVVKYRCERWTPKKAWVTKRIDAFKPWWWRRLLSVPWEIRPVNPKGNQLWIFTGRNEAEAPILWSLDVKSQFIGKNPAAGEGWTQEGKGQQRMSWLDSISDLMDTSLGKLQEMMKDREA